ncbi:hypothetical protein ES703_62892 [subsurface metagenome]
MGGDLRGENRSRVMAGATFFVRVSNLLMNMTLALQQNLP